MITKLLLQLLLISGLISYSQNKKINTDLELVDVVIFEAEAKSGGKFIGIAPDEFEAQIAIDELSFINEGTKYHILGSDIHIMSILISKSISVKDDFISDDEYFEFKYISEIELIALEYMEANDIDTAISFYKSVSLEKSSEIIEQRLKTLQTNYSKYLFESEQASDLVSYSFTK